MAIDVSIAPRRRGCKPGQRLPLDPSFIAVIRAHGPIAPLATIAGYPHAEQLYYALRHAIPVHATNIDRLRALADHLKYSGPLFAEVAK